MVMVKIKLLGAACKLVKRSQAVLATVAAPVLVAQFFCALRLLLLLQVRVQHELSDAAAARAPEAVICRELQRGGHGCMA